MDQKELRELSIVGTRKAYVRGARAFSVWLLDNGHLSYKSEKDRQLVNTFINEKTEQADVELAPIFEEWLRSYNGKT